MPIYPDAGRPIGTSCTWLNIYGPHFSLLVLICEPLLIYILIISVSRLAYIVCKGRLVI